MYDNDEKAIEHEPEVPAPAVDTAGEGTKSFTQFLTMLEDGELNAELSQEVRELNALMNDYAAENGGSAKAKLTITIDFALKAGVFEIISKFAVKKPEMKRRRTMAWSTDGNNFSPNNPRQLNMFEKPRDVTSFGRSDIKTV